jgi:hypothetical protein
MKKLFLVLSIGVCLFLTAQIVSASNGIGTLAANKIYSVNIIAYDNCPKSDNAQRIVVSADYTINDLTGQYLVNIDKTNKIFLVPGSDFRVLDSNACDGDGATLQLEGEAGTSVPYEVYVRLVGPPDSSINVDLCATDPTNGDAIVCDYGDTLVKVRYTGKGEPSFTNATNKLLNLGGYKLFDSRYENYFWDWGTGGKAHAQVWFVNPPQ